MYIIHSAVYIIILSVFFIGCLVETQNYSILYLAFNASSFRVTEENLVFETIQSGPYSSFECFLCSKPNLLLYFIAIMITSSPKGNDRSPDSKSSKYFKYSQIKDFFNWSRAANSAVHGRIRPNFKLI